MLRLAKCFILTFVSNNLNLNIKNIEYIYSVNIIHILIESKKNSFYECESVIIISMGDPSKAFILRIWI